MLKMSKRMKIYRNKFNQMVQASTDPTAFFTAPLPHKKGAEVVGPGRLFDPGSAP